MILLLGLDHLGGIQFAWLALANSDFGDLSLDKLERSDLGPLHHLSSAIQESIESGSLGLSVHKLARSEHMELSASLSGLVVLGEEN